MGESPQDIARLPITSFVVPVGTIGADDRFGLEGTAFLIGDRGIAVTAAHVAEELKQVGNAFALFSFNGKWVPVRILETECHPSEDVAVLQLQNADWKSLHEFSMAEQYASRDYQMWGYPEAIANEIRREEIARDDPLIIRPDLVFFKGYVRRTITRPLSSGIFRGTNFFELSEVGGSCCSGAPVTLPPKGGLPFQVFGIYIGEETASVRGGVGLAVRASAIIDWSPKLIGQPLSTLTATNT